MVSASNVSSDSTSKKAGFGARVLPILVLALLISLYLLHHDLEIASGYQVGPSICSLNEIFDCDALSKSEYSKFMGLPVAMFGSIFYGILLLTAFFYRRPSDSEKLRSSILFLSFLALIPSAYLAYISYAVLGKVCIFCTFLYILNIFLFGMAFFMGRGDGVFFGRLKSGLLSFLQLAFLKRGLGFPLAAFGIAIFIFFGQLEYIRLVLEPRYFAVYDEKIIGELQGLWKKEKSHDVFEKVDLLPGAVIKGNTSAKFTLVEFSDYECPMCQRMAPVVTEILEEMGDRLKVVFLSFPLHNECNRAISTPLHPHACKLSQLVTCKAFEDQEAAYHLHEAIMHAQIASEADYKKFLEQEGLDELSCFSQTEVNESLNAQVELGIIGQIQGTPSFFLNGKRIVFDSFSQLKPLLKQILAGEAGK